MHEICTGPIVGGDALCGESPVPRHSHDYLMDALIFQRGEPLEKSRYSVPHANNKPAIGEN